MSDSPSSKSTHQNPDGGTDVSVRVSISEAARLFGISSRTIRRAITSGEIRYIVVRGRYKLLFESLVAWSQRMATVRRKRDTQGIGQWVDQWKIKNPKYSPRPPSPDSEKA